MSDEVLLTERVSHSELVVSEIDFHAGPEGSSPGRRLRRITMTVVTSVLVFFLKASLGRRIAPSRLALAETYSRSAVSVLSRVPLEVMNNTRPPGRRF